MSFQYLGVMQFHSKCHSKCLQYVHKITGYHRSHQSCFSSFSSWEHLGVVLFCPVDEGSSLLTTIFDKSWVGHFFIVPGGEGPGVGGTSEVPPAGLNLGTSWSMTDVSLAFFSLHSPCGAGLGVLGLGAS